MIHEAAHRFRYLIALLNNSQDGLTVAEIKKDLENHRYKKISVERLRKLLKNMSADRRLDVRRIGTGYGDRWKGEYKAGEIDVAAMTSSRAVWLTLSAATDLSQVLPRVIREELAPEQKNAWSRMQYLKKAKGENLLGWVERVRLRRPSVRMAVDRIEPEIRSDVETVVHDALTNRLPMKIKYWSGHLSDELGETLIYPIGLDCQFRWVTLVCQLAEPYRTEQGKRSPKYDEDYVQLPLHRVLNAEIETETKLPDGFDSQFDMEWYTSRAEPDRPRGGSQRFTQGRKIKFVALVTESYANDLFDSPLQTVGEPQILTMEDNGWFRLTAELIQSDNLLWWCAAMAGDLVVIEPEDFREEVIGMLDEGRSLYNHH